MKCVVVTILNINKYNNNSNVSSEMNTLYLTCKSSIINLWKDDAANPNAMKMNEWMNEWMHHK